MPEADFLALVEDIRTNGQREPIMVFDEMVLDGFHRYRACEILQRPCAERPLPAGLDLVAYVHSQNLHRRHLTGSQRAAAVAATAEWANPGRPSHNVEPGSTLTSLAKSAQVSTKTIQQAKKAQEAGLGEAVRDGKISVKRAAEIADLPPEDRAEAIQHPAGHKKEGTLPDVQAAPLDNELETLRAELSETTATLKETSRMLRECQEDCDSMVKVFEADEKIMAALNEAKRFRELARVTDGLNKRHQSQLKDMTTTAKSWQRKYEKTVKELEAIKAQAEVTA